MTPKLVASRTVATVAVHAFHLLRPISIYREWLPSSVLVIVERLSPRDECQGRESLWLKLEGETEVLFQVSHCSAMERTFLPERLRIRRRAHHLSRSADIRSIAIPDLHIDQRINMDPGKPSVLFRL